jgi:divalent metal cation (Fe/Co/Zn/Cd) transporter
VIFGEDLAALLGLVFALVAVMMTVATGNPMWDALGTVAIGVLLVVVAVFVAIEVKAMLIGQSVDLEQQAEIRRFLEGRPQVDKVISLITLQLGNDVMVSVQAAMQDRPTTRALVEDINRIEVAMKARFPNVRWSFFEPEIEHRQLPDQDYGVSQAPGIE